MYQKSLFYILVVVVVLFSACSNAEKIKEQDSNGLKIEYYRDKKTGAKEGKFTKYYLSGVVNEEATYHSNVLDGVRTMYDFNGKKEVIENYKNGIYQGEFQAFYPSGALKQKGMYNNNQMVGVWISYYENGTLKEEVSIADNEENGPFKEYAENGKIIAEGSYLNGKEQGELKEYNEQGVLIRIANCTEGTCVTSWRADHIIGNK